MTDRKDALTELLAKVEAGDWCTKLALKALPESHVNDSHEWIDPIGWASRALRNGSLDAAKALHEAVLPDWRITHAFGLISGEVAKFNLTHNKKPSTYVKAESNNPARAWLIAILKALIAGENANDNDDDMVIFNPTDTPFLDQLASIVNDPINWTLDPLTAPKPYAGGWTEIITKGEGE
jgi:hypothetical protein